MSRAAGMGLVAVLSACLAPCLVVFEVVAQAPPREELAAVVATLSASWADGSVDGLAGRMPDEGILLHLPDGRHPALSPRMAAAALADLHERSGRGPSAVDQSRPLGGSPLRAFAELDWRPLPDDMTEALHYTVFLGLEERGGRWWVVEVRVLPFTPSPAP